MPLLQEYFYGDGAKLLAVLGADFVAKSDVPIGGGGDSRAVYCLKPQTPEVFVVSLKKLAGG